ncbi:MAG: matrixin family metalloprotease [Verrucomicrobiota bacterium]
MKALPSFLLLFTSFWICLGTVKTTGAALIVVDYTYDTNNFFNTQEKQDAMQAVADRYSRIITSSLAAVSPSGTATGTSAGWRIGFTHPGTGNSWDVSTAANAASDPIVAAAGAGFTANEYGFAGLNADEWILYAGGRSLGAAGLGGSGTGVNFTSTFDDVNGPMHRGFMDNTPTNTSGDLPRWGGSVSFNTAENWHFDLDTAADFGEVDFYSIAMHEVGHALGLNIDWNQWEQSNGVYLGAETLATYNAANGTSLTELDLVSSTNPHFADGVYDSTIFEAGDPNLVGTVGLGNPQDLLMEPIANFTPTQRRIEITELEVAALRDVGWETIPIPEPAHLTLLFPALLFLGAFLRRRRSQQA